MAQWLITKMSKLMGVSVRTLRFYDRIGLLRPSLRLDNGYRLYSETDLQRLQQILALKFLEFDLAHIKKILGRGSSPLEHLQLQLRLLRKKAQVLSDAGDVLERLVAGCPESGPVDWQVVVRMAEVYSMVDVLRRQEYEAIVSEDQLKELVEYFVGLGRSDTFVDLIREERELLEDLLELMQEGADPRGPVGVSWGRRWAAYGKRMSSIPVANKQKARQIVGSLLYTGFDKRSDADKNAIIELISRVIRLAVERCGIAVKLGPPMTVDMMLWILAAFDAAGRP